MPKEVLLFDIDGVVFDAEKFKSWRSSKLLEVTNLDKDRSKEIFDKVKTVCFEKYGGYEPRYYAELLSEEIQDKSVLPLLISTLESVSYKDFHYPEAGEVVRLFFQNKGYVLGIQSQGDFKTQQNKLGDLKECFNVDYIFLYRKSKAMFLEADISHSGLSKGGVVVIDDKPDVVLHLQENGIRAILVKQGRHSENTPNSSLSLVKEEVDSISQLIPLLLR